MQQQHSVNAFSNSDSWVILSDIEQSIKRKIEAVGTPLKDWDINIYRGVLTGCNEAFIISTEKRNEILANCESEDERKRTDELIRPILRGRDIKKYGYDWADLWLIWVPWHFPLHFDESIQGASKIAEDKFRSQYPSVYSYLSRYKKQLSARNKAETGIRYEWYALQRWGAKYWDDFSKPKVMYSETNDYYNTKIAFDIKGFLTDKTCFFVVGERIEWIYFFMCSKIFTHFMQNTSPCLGSSGISLTGISVEKFPVPKFSSKQAEVFTTLLQQNDFSSLNCAVYELYGLSQNEIEFIENQ